MNVCRQESYDSLELGPVVGLYQQQPIHAWFIDARGDTHDYIGTFSVHKELDADDSLVAPGLIYKRRYAGRH